MTNLLISGVEIGEPAQRPETRQAALLSAPVDNEVGQPPEAAADRAMQDGGLTTVPHADQRVPLGGRADELAVVQVMYLVVV
ncbi:hypothetical protein ACFP51_12590 [Streptomyces pratens]|uniref:Uncharacterized protein n=1 Tax=Streptomyces pratens TaxID=887456 RepID=A0ABW1M8L0_9ACTN